MAEQWPTPDARRAAHQPLPHPFQRAHSAAVHQLVAALDLAPHPEGGWYRETMRLPHPAGERDLATAILFLLEQGQRSHWHRVDATELWVWQAGHPLALAIDDGHALLGPDPLAGQQPQAIVPAGGWQSAEAGAGWALATCIVVPGFSFAGFELAPPGWSPGDGLVQPLPPA